MNIRSMFFLTLMVNFSCSVQSSILVKRTIHNKLPNARSAIVRINQSKIYTISPNSRLTLAYPITNIELRSDDGNWVSLQYTGKPTTSAGNPALMPAAKAWNIKQYQGGQYTVVTVPGLGQRIGLEVTAI